MVGNGKRQAGAGAHDGDRPSEKRDPSRFRSPSSSACKGNHEVLNDTAEFYRYFDPTSHAEFLYECVQQAVQHDLVEEVALLRAHDAFVTGVDALFDMPQAKVELLWRFLHQNQGKLSNRARTTEFFAFTETEILRIEQLYDQAWEGRRDVPE